MWETMLQLAPLFQRETSSTRNGLHLVELLAKEAPWKPPITQDIVRIIGYSSDTDGLVLLLKTTSTQLI